MALGLVWQACIQQLSEMAVTFIDELIWCYYYVEDLILLNGLNNVRIRLLERTHCFSNSSLMITLNIVKRRT